MKVNSLGNIREKAGNWIEVAFYFYFLFFLREVVSSWRANSGERLQVFLKNMNS